MARGEEIGSWGSRTGRSKGSQSKPASKDPLCLDTMTALGEKKCQSEGGGSCV